MAETYVVQIEKLVYGGEGLGRLPDGRAVFVPFVLPGEKVAVELLKQEQHFARGHAVQIVQPSPERIQPLCPHFGACGGCHYQHLEYSTQLQVKQDILYDQLLRLGGINNPPISGITPSSEAWNYRNLVQFHPTSLGRLGFMDTEGTHTVPIQECHLPMEDINALWPQIDLSPETGLTRVTLREDSFGEIIVFLEGEDETGPELSLDLPVSVCYQRANGSSLTLAGQDHLIYQILGKQLAISPETFFQVNLSVAEKMVAYVLAKLPQVQNLNTLELYSGAGLFSTFLAERSHQLIAIESSPSACYDFANNLDPYENVSLYEGLVEEVLPALAQKLPALDLVLLDPPRAGLHPKARQALEKLQSQQILYISCDPSTLARDLKHLCAAGYTLIDVHLFDMFPQTYHIETVSLLAKA